MHIISKNIKALRTERGWTQQEMADMLFVTRQTVSNWENGKALPDVETLLQIAEKLDIDVNELVYGKRKISEQLKKSIIFSLMCLIALSICQYILNYVNLKYLKNNFILLANNLYYFTINPLKLFFSGMLLIQIFKSCGVIKKCSGSRYSRIYKYIVIAVFILFSIAPLNSHRFDILLIKYHFKIGEFANATSFNGMDYALVLPEWVNKIINFLSGITYSGPKFNKPPYYHIFTIMGIVYELAKPYRSDGTAPIGIDTEKAKVTVKQFMAQPDVYLKKLFNDIKDTVSFVTGKSAYVKNCVIIILVSHLICAITGNVSAMLKKYIHTGITSPLTVFVVGVVAAIIFRKVITLYKTDGFRYRKAVNIITVGLMILSFAVFIPDILREATMILDRINIITVTGSYDITGWVLTPPVRFDRLHTFVELFNTTIKIWWWAVLGFVTENIKPYHGKEKYNTEK